MGEQPVYGTRESIDWEATAELWKERARDSEAKRAELEAVIEKVRERWEAPTGGVGFGYDTNAILESAPSVVLGEHDREVRADELCAWADWIENASGTVPPLGVSPFDLGTVVRAMRSGQRPFGASAAAIRNGEHA